MEEEGAVQIVQTPEQAKRSGRLHFNRPNERAEHLQAFRAWLPELLQAAPDLDWNQLPSRVMGYLIRTVADSPDAVSITLAIGCAMQAIKHQSLLGYCHQVAQLLRALRAHYGMTQLADLRTRQVWDRFVVGRMLSPGEVRQLTTYDALASAHVRPYLDGLTVRDHVIWERHAFPPLPRGFIDQYGQRKAVLIASQQRRKEQSDVLVPLFPLLVELAQLRKQAAERLIKEFRRQLERVRTGEIALPVHFQYTDRQFAVSQGAPSLAEVELVERAVTLSFTLWDRVSWVKANARRYSKSVRWQAKRQTVSYAPEHTLYFLQYHGKPEDLLWCGDLIANRRFGKQSAEVGSKLKDFDVSRPGVLLPERSDSLWLRFASQHALQPDEHVVLFEPESLYRAALYAAALATLSLTNGSRVTELLQVSAIRFETLVVDELRNQQPTGRKIGILVQNLLPKGYTTESDRQYFLISEMAARLLTEIGHLLETTYGGSIPTVQPNQNMKEEDLHPEPYLFQWDASADGQLGLLTIRDVSTLLRLLFHGLTLTTRTGNPIRVATHLLRHVMATYARAVKKVPAEAVAYLLHHRMVLPNTMHALTISEATTYYSRLPLEHLLALLYEAQSQLSSQHAPSYLQVPTPRTLEEMDAALRQVFEQWGTIGPTMLGYCSAGLCIRPNNRALCLDCQFLVPHYSNVTKARTWRKLYVLQAELYDAHGHHVDAQQARQMIQYLDDIINVMQIQIRTRQDGGYLPFADTLPPAQEDERDAE